MPFLLQRCLHPRSVLYQQTQNHAEQTFVIAQASPSDAAVNVVRVCGWWVVYVRVCVGSVMRVCVCDFGVLIRRLERHGEGAGERWGEVREHTFNSQQMVLL